MDKSPHHHQYRLSVARFVVTVAAALAVGGPSVLDAIITQTNGTVPIGGSTGIESAVLRGVAAGLIAYFGMVLVTKAFHREPEPATVDTPSNDPRSVDTAGGGQTDTSGADSPETGE